MLRAGIPDAPFMNRLPPKSLPSLWLDWETEASRRNTVFCCKRMLLAVSRTLRTFSPAVATKPYPRILNKKVGDQATAIRTQEIVSVEEP
jgi:hypothetical protein